jgi:RNA polymerase sigma-70 factor (ECF subfamily)
MFSVIRGHGNRDGVDAFARLYDGTFETVYGFVFARTGDEAAAAEILQDTYAAAWAAMGRFERRSRDATWVIGIARRKLADHYRRAIRRKRREGPEELLDTLPGGESPEEHALANESRERVAGALAALRPLYRYALALKYLDGRSLKEIARALGRTPKAVDGILQRAKAGFIREYRSMDGRSENDG